MTPTVGNRCAHDPSRIRRSLRRCGPHKRAPLVLSETARLFARAIVERPDDFPELRHVTADRNRRRRSERLEAIGLVVLALFVRTDLLSLVVRWEGEGLDAQTLAKWTGLHVRRIGRALFDLRWGAFVRGPGRFGPDRIAQPVDTYDPTVCRGEGCPSCKSGAPHVCRRANCVACARGLPHLRGKAAIRQITILVFEKVGTDGWLADEQKKRWADMVASRAPRPMTAAAVEGARRSVDAQIRTLAASDRLGAVLAKREQRPPD
jgi:hypothetical protein